MSANDVFSPIEDIINDARNGRMFILVDDEDRENEGDLVVPAEMATPDAINFMARFGRGLICLALTGDRIRELGLPMMPRRHNSRHLTAFTVSIEAREGVTTGISAPDRARTIATAIDPRCGPDDVVTPGHVFPLEARDGGVLVRAGHTEAAVDIARLAGRNAAGVICEILRDDGTMARRDDLVGFAREHDLRVATIADLIAYRLRYDRVVDRVGEWEFVSAFGGTFKAVVYVDKVAQAEHVALVKSDLAPDKPVPVRVHVLNIMDDVLGDARSGHTGELHEAMRMVGREEAGIVVLIRELLPWSIKERLNGTREANPGSGELREIGIGGQILRDLGVRDMILLSNSKRTYVGLDGFGLRVVEQRPIPLGES